MTVGYWCENCNDLTEPIRVYECGTDGWVGAERRCEECNRFIPRRDEDGCENCFEEVVEVETLVDHDGTVIRADDYEEDGASLAERTAQQEAKKQKEDAKRRAQAENKTLQNTYETTWSEVLPGQQVIAYDWNGQVDTLMDATVLSMNKIGSNCDPALSPGSLIVTVQHFGTRVEVHDAAETVRVRDTEPVDVPSPEERFTIQHGNDDMYGSPLKFISAEIGRTALTADGTVYMGEITGRHSERSGMHVSIAAFTDPREATAFAHTARTAATELRELGAEESKVDAPEVPLMDGFTAPAPIRYVNFNVSTDEMTGSPAIGIQTGSSQRSMQSSSITNPALLDAVADTALLIAQKLSTLIGQG